MPRTEVLPKTRYTVYLRRSREFAVQMDRAAAEGAWNSVGLLAIHTVISGCDAISVHYRGLRWSGQDHGGVLELLRSLGLPGADGALRQISRVLELKNRVEYEAREFGRDEAEALLLSAQRVLNWVRAQLPG